MLLGSRSATSLVKVSDRMPSVRIRTHDSTGM